MATMRQYDEQIAPLLLDVAKRCDELGMSFVARVEWKPDKAGITQIGIERGGIGQKLTHLAAHCRGNIDLLCMEAIKRFDVSNSIVLSQFQNHK